MIEIDTGKLSSASKQASKTAEECRDYRETLDSKISKRLRSYSGERSYNLTSAQDKINAKRGKLANKATAFSDFSRRISDFRNEVLNQEDRLESRIKRLIGNFRERYDLKDGNSWWNKLIDTIGGFLGIDTDKLKQALAEFRNFLQNAKEGILNWYKYKGGKEILTAVAKILVAVAAVVVAFITFPASGIIAIIFASVALVITIANAVVTIIKATGAIGDAFDGQNHLAARSLYHAKEETATSMLRREGLYFAADVIDFVDMVCNLYDFFSDIKDFSKAMENYDSYTSMIKDGLWKNFRELTLNPLEGIKALYTGNGETNPMKVLESRAKLFEKGVKLFDGIMDIANGGLSESSGVLNVLASYVFDTTAVKGAAEGKVDFKASNIIDPLKSGITFLDSVSTVANNFANSQKTLFNFTYESKAFKFSDVNVGPFELGDFKTVGDFAVSIGEKLTSVKLPTFSPASFLMIGGFQFADGVI